MDLFFIATSLILFWIIPTGGNTFFFNIDINQPLILKPEGQGNAESFFGFSSAIDQDDAVFIGAPAWKTRTDVSGALFKCDVSNLFLREKDCTDISIHVRKRDTEDYSKG